jgi:transcriptional regulator with XRE-family HTH domain
MRIIRIIYMFDLGIKMRSARKEKKLTQAQLAEKAGISRKTLGQIEAGTVADIGIRKVERVLEVLGLELSVRRRPLKNCRGRTNPNDPSLIARRLELRQKSRWVEDGLSKAENNPAGESGR